MRRGFVCVILAAVLAAVGSQCFPPVAIAATTFTVSNTNDSGSGSLRSAIAAANSAPGSRITFSIGSGPRSIVPTSPLPVVTAQTSIDATTQGGFSGVPLIELNGRGAGGGAIGIRFTGAAAGSSIRGFIIDRFSAQGIFIDTSNVTVQGNYIGTAADGRSGAGNGGDGVAIFSGTSRAASTGNTIGGLTAAARNVISANGGNGVGVTAQDGGKADGTVITGNFIGTDVNGTVALGNVGDGVLVNNATGAGFISGTVIGSTSGATPGGACTGGCNLVSGNGANGLGLWHGGVVASSVVSNYVGVDVTGTSAVPNGNIGIEVNETANNTVGGTTPAERNVFSGNRGAGVFLTGASATGNVVQGNFVGTNAAGTAALGNTKMGIGIGASPGAVGANSDRIGGTTAVSPTGACSGSCNLISGNGQNGILVVGAESSGHVIVGNVIGLDATGTYGIGNSYDGIGLLGAPNIRIGGSAAAERNLISSNGGSGVVIAGSSATGSVIEGNAIGETGGGGSSGNSSRGIVLADVAHVALLGNSIAFNAGLGIDLNNDGQPLVNDAGDGDGGANDGQNSPTVLAATTRSGTTKIGGQLNSVPSSAYRLDFFQNAGCNAAAPNDYGPGQTFVGSTLVQTDKFGNTAWGFTSPVAIPGNRYITATATRVVGGNPDETSEFSQCLLVNAAKPALTNGATWFLKRGLTSGGADQTFGYGFPSYFLLCAWDPNQPGVKLPVIYSGGTWYERASYTTGTADNTFVYGGSQRPVCGDWNGDGVDTPGVVDSTGRWLLRNENNSGVPDAGSFTFGDGSGTPVVGDWNGAGTDTVGVVSADRAWALAGSNSDGGGSVIRFSWGPQGGTAIVGDWNGDGVDTVGVVTEDGGWIIRNSNDSGPANGQFTFGFRGATPLVW